MRWDWPPFGLLLRGHFMRLLPQAILTFLASRLFATSSRVFLLKIVVSLEKNP
jgi:hypothetical protein